MSIFSKISKQKSLIRSAEMEKKNSVKTMDSLVLMHKIIKRKIMQKVLLIGILILSMEKKKNSDLLQQVKFKTKKRDISMN
jgi:hypothetical protein